MKKDLLVILKDWWLPKIMKEENKPTTNNLLFFNFVSLLLALLQLVWFCGCGCGWLDETYFFFRFWHQNRWWFVEICNFVVGLLFFCVMFLCSTFSTWNLFHPTTTIRASTCYKIDELVRRYVNEEPNEWSYFFISLWQ